MNPFSIAAELLTEGYCHLSVTVLAMAKLIATGGGDLFNFMQNRLVPADKHPDVVGQIAWKLEPWPPQAMTSGGTR